MKRFHGSEKADALQTEIMRLIGDFDEECTEDGLSNQMIDAHIAAVLIQLLGLVVSERETYSAKTLIDVTRKELRAAERST